MCFQANITKLITYPKSEITLSEEGKRFSSLHCDWSKFMVVKLREPLLFSE